MTIEFRCDGCKALFRTADDKAGMRTKCPHCGLAITAPYPAGIEPYDEFQTESRHARQFSGDDFYSHFGGGVSPRRASRPPRAETASPGKQRPCPMCGESIAAAARTCTFCGERVWGNTSHTGRPQVLPTSALAVISLILAVFGLVFCWVPGVNIALSVITLIVGGFGWMQIRNATHQGEGVAIAGFVLGGMAFVASAVCFVGWLMMRNNGF